MKTLTVQIVLALAIISAINPAIATTFLNTKSPSFEVDTVYNDDVFISGARIKFDSRVYGDLFAFSYEIVQTDTVAGNFMAFCYSVQNLGPVLGSYRAMGRSISCNADIGRNLLLFGQEINVGPTSHIGRDADIAGASLVFQGEIKGNLKVKAEYASISGKIDGNLDFTGDSLTINPNTIIKGNINYVSPIRATIAPGSVINGKTNWKQAEPEKVQEKSKSNFWSAITWIISVRGYLIMTVLISLVFIALTFVPLLHISGGIILIFLWIVLVVSGNLLILFTRSKASASERVIEARLFPSMGLGFIIFFLTPIVAIVLFFTILAAPLSPLILMLFGAASFAGGIYGCLYVGRRICGIFNPATTAMPGYLCFTIGMTIILMLSAIPILGYLVVLAVLMTGLGGLVQSFGKPKADIGIANASDKI